TYILISLKPSKKIKNTPDNIKREVPSTTRFLVTSSILPLADTGVCRKVLHNISWFLQGLLPHLLLSLANESSCNLMHTWRRDVHFLLLYHEQKTTNHQVAYLQILLVHRALPAHWNRVES